MGRNFPNAFQGYTLTVREAHQSTKARPGWSVLESVITAC